MGGHLDIFDVPLVTLILAPFFFLVKVPFLAFLNTERVWPYRHAHDVPLVIPV